MPSLIMWIIRACNEDWTRLWDSHVKLSDEVLRVRLDNIRLRLALKAIRREPTALEGRGPEGAYYSEAVRRLCDEALNRTRPL